MRTNKLSELSPEMIEAISRDAAELFLEENADLLVCFDTVQTVKACRALLTIEGLPQYLHDDFTSTNGARAMGEALVTLSRRGALDPFVRVSPLPASAQEQLDRLAGIIVDPVAETRIAQASAIDDVVNDWSVLDSRAFKNKYLTGPQEQRAVYEAACAAGRI